MYKSGWGAREIAWGYRGGRYTEGERVVSGGKEVGKTGTVFEGGAEEVGIQRGKGAPLCILPNNRRHDSVKFGRQIVGLTLSTIPRDVVQWK